MSVLSEIQRIQTNVDKMKSKLQSQGLTCANLDAVANLVSERGVVTSTQQARVNVTSKNPAFVYFIDSSGSMKRIGSSTSFSNIATKVGDLLFVQLSGRDVHLYAIGAIKIGAFNEYVYYRITSASVRIDLGPQSGAAD